MKITTILWMFLIGTLIISCDERPTTDYGNDFIGKWEAYGSEKIRIEIEPLIREGQMIEERFKLTFSNKEKFPDLPKNYMQEGQYNFWFVTADPKDNYHPFKEFLYKNSFEDKTYLKLKIDDKNVLFRRFKGFSDLAFKRIE